MRPEEMHSVSLFLSCKMGNKIRLEQREGEIKWGDSHECVTEVVVRALHALRLLLFQAMGCLPPVMMERRVSISDEGGEGACR